MICHGNPRFTPGGTELVARDLAAALSETGLADASFASCVTALHRPRRDGSALQSVDGRPGEFLLHSGRFDPFMLCQADDGTGVAGISALLTVLRPDIVHFHHLLHVGAETIALVRRMAPQARIVFTLHDFFPICAREGLMTKSDGEALCHEANPDSCHLCLPDRSASQFALRRFYLGNMLSLVDCFVAPSRFIRDRFVAWGLPAAKIVHIPNGVPPAAPVEDGDDARPRNRFGYFGRIAPHKGALLAVDAARQIGDSADLSLAIFGGAAHQDQAFKDGFDKALRRAKDRVFHHGPYGREDTPRLMRGIDWVVVPSRWWENAPLVVLEAFRHGRPVIAADVGGMAELVTADRDGLHFRFGDAADLARTMKRAATEPGLWDRLRRNIAPPPTTVDSAKAHAALYREILNQEQRMSA